MWTPHESVELGPLDDFLDAGAPARLLFERDGVRLPVEDEPSGSAVTSFYCGCDHTREEFFPTAHPIGWAGRK